MFGVQQKYFVWVAASGCEQEMGHNQVVDRAEPMQRRLVLLPGRIQHQQVLKRVITTWLLVLIYVLFMDILDYILVIEQI